MRNAYIILGGKSEEKRPLVTPSSGWDNNIKMDFEEIGILWAGFIWLRIGTRCRLS
jgi:hypothetical protein